MNKLMIALVCVTIVVPKGELHYRGRLDDARISDTLDRTPELLNAMHLIAKTGKGPEEQYPIMGCSIKWKS